MAGMKRREFLLAVGGAALWFPFASVAQTNRVYRIGILETLPVSSNAASFDALRLGLSERGYVVGKNLQIEYRSADGRAERFPDLAAELVRSNVDLIATRGTPAAKAARAATATIPIVMCAIGEPLGMGAIETLARPGGNVTGLSAFVTELSGKRIELLKQAFASIFKVGFLQNMANPVAVPQWEEIKAVASALAMSAELFDIRSQADIKLAMEAARDRKMDAISVGIDGTTQANAAMIVELARQYRIPTAYPSREFVDAGGLLSYGPNYPDLYYRSASLMDKIFKGAKPGDLPVEQPTKLELIINQKTANALGIKVSPTLLATADEVIE
jgi:putative ABC transport system substrate-binding protein